AWVVAADRHGGWICWGRQLLEQGGGGGGDLGYTVPVESCEVGMATDDPRFGGIARLDGTEALARLQGSHMAVVGIGGVGSWAAEALARTGIGRITLIDMDDICVTNTNRQLPAMAGNIGRLKVEVMAQRI